MSKGSAPAAPDPYTTAAAQLGESEQAGSYQTALNDVNTTGPTGSTSYAVTGYDPTTGAPIRTQTTSLSPAEQGILNSSQGVQQGQLNTAGNLLTQFNGQTSRGVPNIAPVQYNVNGQPIQSSIDTSGVPGIQSIEGSQGLEQYGQNTALAGEEAAAQPGLTQAREQLDSSLRNAGSHPGDPAYDKAMASLDASQTAQQTQMAGAAITAGTGLQNTTYGEEANTNQQMFTEAQQEQAARNTAQGQQFSQGLSNAQLSNTAGGTALADYAQQTGIPLNELSAILGGSQVSTPSAVAPGSGTIAAPNIQDAFNTQYQGALAGYNANVSTSNAEMGDAASIASIAALAAFY